MPGNRSPRSLGSVLEEVIASLGLGDKITHGRVIAAWSDVIGERIGREVEKVWIRDRKLYVRIKSTVWRQELYLNRTSWCRRLNEELGSNLVDEIVFR